MVRNPKKRLILANLKKRLVGVIVNENRKRRVCRLEFIWKKQAAWIIPAWITVWNVLDIIIDEIDVIV